MSKTAAETYVVSEGESVVTGRLKLDPRSRWVIEEGREEVS